MIVEILVLGAAVLALLVWAGRRPATGGQALRIARAVAAALAAAGAVGLGLRGQAILAVGLLVLAAWLGQSARRSPRSPASEAMSEAQARSILGVDESAGRPEIQAAYRRLIQRAHPDQGGSAGLAAQLNAARDRLLK